MVVHSVRIVDFVFYNYEHSGPSPHTHNKRMVAAVAQSLHLVALARWVLLPFAAFEVNSAAVDMATAVTVVVMLVAASFPTSFL